MGQPFPPSTCSTSELMPESSGTQYGKALGLRILAIDTSDEKRDMCLSLGAEAFIDFKT